VRAYPIVLAKDAGLPVQDLQADKNNSVRASASPTGRSQCPHALRGGFGAYYNFLPVFIGFGSAASTPAVPVGRVVRSRGGIHAVHNAGLALSGRRRHLAQPERDRRSEGHQDSESYQWNLTLDREVLPTWACASPMSATTARTCPGTTTRSTFPGSRFQARFSPTVPISRGPISFCWRRRQLHPAPVAVRDHQALLERSELSDRVLLEPFARRRSGGGRPQDPYNARTDRGNSDQIRRTSSPTRQLRAAIRTRQEVPHVSEPVIKTSRWGLAGFRDHLSAHRHPVLPSFSATQTGWRGGRRTWSRTRPCTRQQDMDQWFNPAAFATTRSFHLRNAARNLLFTPGDIVVDLSVLKDFSLYERIRAQFRAEFFNFPNHFNWGGPGSNISVPASVGRITGRGRREGRPVWAEGALLMHIALLLLATLPWWQKEPLRIVDIVMSLGRIDEVAPAQLAEWKAGQFYNSEHLEVMGMHGGLDDQEFFFKSKVAGKINRDFLGEYVAQAHKRGIRVMIYFNVHWYTTRSARSIRTGARSPRAQARERRLRQRHRLLSEHAVARVVLPDLARPGRLRRGRITDAVKLSTP